MLGRIVFMFVGQLLQRMEPLSSGFGRQSCCDGWLAQVVEDDTQCGNEFNRRHEFLKLMPSHACVERNVSVGKHAEPGDQFL